MDNTCGSKTIVNMVNKSASNNDDVQINDKGPGREFYFRKVQGLWFNVYWHICAIGHLQYLLYIMTVLV